MHSSQFALHAEIEDRHWWFLGRRTIVHRLLQQVVPVSKDKLLLDLGCGTGGTLGALSQDYRCVGFDTSPEAIKFAQARIAGAHFVCGSSLEAVKDVTSQASICLLMDVLEHVSDDFWLLSRLLAAMPPGGHVLVTVPADMALWSEHDVAFQHYRRYDKARLMRVWEGLPVTPRLVSYYNTYLYPVVRVLRPLSRWLGRTWGAMGTDFRMPARPVNTFLTRLFASEARTLAGHVDQPRADGFPFGVSLLAVLRRDEGMIRPRRKPQDLAADYHTPATHEHVGQGCPTKEDDAQ